MIRALLQRMVGRRWTGNDARARCKVLFVCMGNLCRSPTAEAVFRHQVQAAGLASDVVCASAGTHDVNLGYGPDGRARAAALKRGYNMARFRGRGINDEDFARFDLIVAMDQQNLEALRTRCPPEHVERLRLLMEFAQRHKGLEIPDPYYGNAQGFEVVLDMIEDACSALLQHVRETHLSRPND